ncbi:hypothetical protein EDD21DRAFT_132767 [Dissophora ornata]|nr:hypothetical protein EDD21DRAFT_132767 [Dissophora ornata]
MRTAFQGTQHAQRRYSRTKHPSRMRRQNALVWPTLYRSLFSILFINLSAFDLFFFVIRNTQQDPVLPQCVLAYMHTNIDTDKCLLFLCSPKRKENYQHTKVMACPEPPFVQCLAICGGVKAWDPRGAIHLVNPPPPSLSLLYPHAKKRKNIPYRKYATDVMGILRTFHLPQKTNAEKPSMLSLFRP